MNRCMNVMVNAEVNTEVNSGWILSDLSFVLFIINYVGEHPRKSTPNPPRIHLGIHLGNHLGNHPPH